MHNIKRIHDIGMPIYNGMWCYKPEWANRLTAISETSLGDASTVYRFDLCSHSGTYVETSQHKLKNDIQLDDFELSDFVRACKVISIAPTDPAKEVTRRQFQVALAASGESIDVADSVIIATGWGLNHQSPNFLMSCPFFAEELVDYLCEKKLHLLGVDTPIIDNAQAPFGAVPKLFESNSRMLLIAPLMIDPLQVRSGRYLLVAAPLNIASVSASLCRPLLIESESSI